MSSIWTEGINLPEFESLKGDRKTDVLIIGGGMAGILCAYFLQQEGVDYTLVEGKRICSGVTGNTTAKITAQHGLLYRRLVSGAGREKARLYLEANQKAVELYAGLCSTMDCDFEVKTSWVYSLSDSRKLEEETDALEQIGFQAKLSRTTPLPFAVAGAIGFPGQAQFHPLKFATGIAGGLKIYENMPVKELMKNKAVTETGTILFEKCIFATHFPIDNKHGMYFLKLYQHRSYVLALEHAPQLDGMYVDEAMCGMSFRNYRELLLIGGGDHRTGKQGGNWQELRAFATQYDPHAAEVGRWAAQDCMKLDQVPYIGPYAKNMSGCFAATGFHKWGMTYAETTALGKWI